MASIINMLDAKSKLSRLVAAVESGAEPEIVIARNGRPAAKLVPIGRKPVGKRLGLMDGRWKVPDEIHDYETEIGALFHGKS